MSALSNNPTMNIPNATVLKQLADNNQLVSHPLLDFIKVY